MKTRATVFCFLLVTLTAAFFLLVAGKQTQGMAKIFYVAVNGSDTTGNGTLSSPWATIPHALEVVPDGSTVLVRPGIYTGRVSLSGHFQLGVTVRSEVPYQAQLRNNDRVIVSYAGCDGITIEGFDIAHTGPGSGALVIHLDGGGTSAHTRRIILRNNILHDSYNNDILKINNNAKDILVEGNIFYNQAGSDEHIDANSTTNVIIQDNVFFNDFAGSGRTDQDTSSFIVIKDSNGNQDGILGSEHVVVRRNVFLHWEGSSGQGFVRTGEDGTENFEARDVLVENNLFLGNNTQQIRSPFQMMGVYSVTVRANTVAGNLPAKEFGIRIFAYGSNPNNDQIHLYNNIWSDPTGTMGDTFNRGNRTEHLTFDNNLFWNGGNPFPTSPESIIEVIDDINRVVGNPLLGDQTDLVNPRWIPERQEFADGSTTIREVFEGLVLAYGIPGEGSPALDAADTENMPDEDIFKNPRPVGNSADIGAYEVQEYGFRLSASPRTMSIQNEETAIFQLDLQPLGGFTEAVTLAAAHPAPNLQIMLEPAELVPPGQATLIVTDTHTNTLDPGRWYNIQISGTSENINQELTVFVLVDGRNHYLPNIHKEINFFRKMTG